MAFLTVCVCIVSLLLLYRYVASPSYLSPLSKIPNTHFTSPFSNGWILWQRYRGTANRAIHHAHERMGPIVRLGSTEISVNSVEGVKTVYSDAFNKDDWYSRAFDNYGKPNMFSMVHSRPHADRKRMIASLYSNSTLQSSPEIRKASKIILMERLLPIIEAAAKDQSPVDGLELSLAVSMDFISAYLFGLHNGSNFLQDVKARKRWLAVHHSTKAHSFWPLEFPRLTSFLSMLGIHLVPQQVVAASEEVKDLCLQMLKKVESSSGSSTDDNGSRTKPVVHDQLSRQLRASSDKASSPAPPPSPSHLRLTLASELMDHTMAGTETSGWTLTYLMHELSQRPYLQSTLRSELLSLPHPMYCSPPSALTGPTADLWWEPRALAALPFLDALLHETLRLHPAVPGSQPRLTPQAPVTLVGHANIPADIRVAAQAYSLHRNADIFPNPEVWQPERWLRASLKGRDEMMRWFWAFGSGGRMCIGNHFAMLELKMIVAVIYTNYTTKIIDDEGIEQMDGYSTGPKGNKLVLQFEVAGR